VVDVEQSRWLLNRVDDAERRIKTMRNVVTPAAIHLARRTTSGRKARIIEMHLRHAEEEIALVSSDGEVA